MMKYTFPMIVSVILFNVSACSKGGDAGTGGGGIHVDVPTDTTKPGILINTPADNQIFISGSTINVSGKVTDDFGLYRGTIRIVNDATGFALVHQPYEIHGMLLYNFNLNHVASVIAPVDYTVTVAFEDHGNNSFSRSVKVKVNP
jgi:hypothetical protein